MGPKHPDTATSLNNLGDLLKLQRDYAAARPYYDRALTIREEVLGPKHPDTATSLNSLGNLMRRQGAYAATRLCYERALAIREEVLGPKHPDTAASLINLIELLISTHDYAAAQLYSERVLMIRYLASSFEHLPWQFFNNIKPRGGGVGIIRKITDKGFGFIRPDSITAFYCGIEKDVWFYGRFVIEDEYDMLREGDIVSFTVMEFPKGLHAINVKRINDQDMQG